MRDQDKRERSWYPLRAYGVLFSSQEHKDQKW